MKTKATFLSYISAEKKLRKEQSKSARAKENKATLEQITQFEKVSITASNN